MSTTSVQEGHVAAVTVSPAAIGARRGGIPGVRGSRWRQGHPQPAIQDRLGSRDWSLIVAAAVTMLVGVLALYWSYQNHLVLIYEDAASHLNIARRVLDSRTPGIVMLGTVWLPIPHLLLQPFIYVDFLYYTGLAGGCLGVLCFEITAVMLFLSIRLMTQHELAAWVGLAVLLTNPNMLYLQTTGLTEPVLLMAMTTAGYFLLRWSKGQSHADLLMGGLFTGLAVGSRYDGWFFAVACAGLIALTVYLRWREAARTEGITLAYLVLPVFTMFMWFYYNWLIFGDALEFQRGQYSAAAAQAGFAKAGLLPTKHHLLLSTLTYGWSVLDNLGGLVLLAAVVGLVIYLITTRLRPESLIMYTFLSAALFNILSLWAGQTIILTPQTTPAGYFNVRYGIMLLPAAALFIAYLTNSLAHRVQPALVAMAMTLVLVGQGVLWLPDWPNSIITVADGRTGLSAQKWSNNVTGIDAGAPSAQYLREHYRGGGVLISDSTYSWFVPEARIHMREYIDAYTGRLWKLALQDPTPYVRWVVLHPGVQSDPVTAALSKNVNFTRHYTLQQEAYGYAVFRRTTP